MPLPLSRDFDAVDTGPLPHTTVNNIQDSIIGAGHGDLWVQWAPRADFALELPSGDSTHRFIFNTDLNVGQSRLPDQIRGRRILQWELRGSLLEADGDVFDVRLVKAEAGAASVTIGLLQTAAPALGVQILGETLGVPEVIAAGTIYLLVFSYAQTGGTGQAQIWNAAVRYDKP